MSSGTKDKVVGVLHQAKGAIKAAVGKVTDNPKLKAEAEIEKAEGVVQEKVGEVKKVFGK